MPLKVTSPAVFMPRTRPHAVFASTNSLFPESTRAWACGRTVAQAKAAEVRATNSRLVSLGEERSKKELKFSSILLTPLSTTASLFNRGSEPLVILAELTPSAHDLVGA